MEMKADATVKEKLKKFLRRKSTTAYKEKIQKPLSLNRALIAF